MRLQLFVAHLWLVGLIGTCNSKEAPVVDLGYAKYRGSVNTQTGNVEYLGIRYAAPPIGNLRWKKPQTPPEVGGVLEANDQPNLCFQGVTGANVNNPFSGNETFVTPAQSSPDSQILPGLPPESEDCLFLNVWTPGALNGTNKQDWPVVVWIHGGGYAFGGASIGGRGDRPTPFSGSDLVHASGNAVVAVVIQYRLGVFGFLAGKEVKLNGALNAGLLDQQFALQWVQQHITKFGGDPRKVTIWGQSAGGGSVLHHLIANGGNTNPPLFRGGILSSVFLPAQYPFDSGIPEHLYASVVQQTGCSNTSDTLNCLRKLDATVLQAVNFEISNNSFVGTVPFLPVVDGSFVPQSAMHALKQGKVNTNHVLAVTNTFEGRILVPSSLPSSLNVTEYIYRLFPFLQPREIGAAVKYYQRFGSDLEQMVEIIGEATFRCPSYFLLRSLDGAGYEGHFAIPPATHFDDLYYYFPSLNPDGIPPFGNSSFVNTFSGAFLDFVLNQDPNAKHNPESILPSWPKWKSTNSVEMLFNRTGDMPDIRAVSTPSDLLERCDFWASVSESTSQ